MIHSKLIFFSLPIVVLIKLLLRTSVTTAVAQWRTITRLIWCSFKRQIIEMMYTNAEFILRGHSVLMGLTCRLGWKGEVKTVFLNAFLAWVLCPGRFAQGHCGLEELWNRVSSPWWVNPALYVPSQDCSEFIWTTVARTALLMVMSTHFGPWLNDLSH